MKNGQSSEHSGKVRKYTRIKSTEAVCCIYQNIEDSSMLIFDDGFEDFAKEHLINIHKKYVINTNGTFFDQTTEKKLFDYVDSNLNLLNCMIIIGLSDRDKIKQIVVFARSRKLEIIFV